MQPMTWIGVGSLQSHSYTCGYCGYPLASEKGWFASRAGGSPTKSNPLMGTIYVCHYCGRPTFFDHENRQTPGVAYGRSVQHVTDIPLNEIYEEARKATSAGCYTAAILCCRKLLMHLAVSKGAKEGDTFKSYVEYLAANGHITAGSKPWVEQIKVVGNEANHEVKMMKKEDAQNLLKFCEMLLITIFQYPAEAQARNGNGASN
jgi:hypothetical protein